MHLLFTTAAAVITFIILLILVRWIGQTQISQSTYFNWVAGACMGNIAANMLASTSIHSIVDGAIQLVAFSAVTIVAALIAIKSKRFRLITSGKPVVLIHQGEYILPHLKQTKVNVDLLHQMLREQGYFDYRSIKYAILEPTGSLSVLPIDEQKPREDNVSQTTNPSASRRQESEHVK
ncbi:DUF421 domain-containing protein [Alicyclobacillus fastidiosus]|uniref:DUF421 domain-containing protein n=1 Tax=Alicyclobacillus fastidiosus TaxID=392011 RepID=A0ABV5ALP6_9BACL|nr:YetF domain-containing protein [Alicyclobacillus fastidiosus]WEH08220.1 DUF421 domain-containing protein [Alicyclobacillus fastidiosus]